MPVNTYYVYIMSSGRRTLYVGVTGDLQRRVREHRHKLIEGFTKRYNGELVGNRTESSIFFLLK